MGLLPGCSAPWSRRDASPQRAEQSPLSSCRSVCKPLWNHVGGNMFSKWQSLPANGNVSKRGELGDAGVAEWGTAGGLCHHRGLARCGGLLWAGPRQPVPPKTTAGPGELRPGRMEVNPVTSPCSQDYVPSPQCLFPPTDGPNGNT